MLVRLCDVLCGSPFIVPASFLSPLYANAIPSYAPHPSFLQPYSHSGAGDNLKNGRLPKEQQFTKNNMEDSL